MCWQSVGETKEYLWCNGKTYETEPALDAADYPVLAEMWDNDEDAIYDEPNRRPC